MPQSCRPEAGAQKAESCPRQDPSSCIHRMQGAVS
eukprot:CAMPEP_0181485408 /NCGR_PEP_ID=MMETSP1110-20121109/46553_1 /TAXON_ID=174948 /ORGANISM="Symbiodinium sp., Strain CCMP421" /LENGTH=34 /DNA_ID= /DNA_START= /DNA_END= /DNA_ORIENTATION=